MKKYFLAVLACSLLAVVCCQDESGIEKEKKAIVAVIEAEKIAYYAQDLAGLDEPWVKEPTSRKLFLTTHGITEIVGWDDIHQHNIEAVERDWSEHVETVRYKNYAIEVYGNTALVFHDSDHQITDHGNESTLSMRRIIHLVKIEDTWKIDMMAMYFMPHNPLGQEIEM